VSPIVADQLREIDDDQDEQNSDADRVDRHDPVLQAREIVGVLSDLSEE
jgi:hypothetical protein